MSKIITSDNGVELEVCSLGIAVVNHEEETETWARLTDVQRVELAAALDPGRRGLLVRLDNQAATLATYRRECDEALRKKGEAFDRAVRAERERDEAVARAEQAENARDTAATRAAQLEKEVCKWRTSTESAHSDFLQAAHDRDEWKARAEAAAREREEIADQFDTFRAEIVAEAVKSRESAVTRADIEKAIDTGIRGTTDGDLIDPDSDLPAGECVRLAIDAVCDVFGVEAEQAADPVEEQTDALADILYGHEMVTDQMRGVLERVVRAGMLLPGQEEER